MTTIYGAKKPEIKIITEEGTEILLSNFKDLDKYANTQASIIFKDEYLNAVIPIQIFGAFMQEYAATQQDKFLKIYSTMTKSFESAMSVQDSLKMLEMISKIKKVDIDDGI